LVLYRGIYYTEEQFKMYLLQIVNNKTPLNYYICENPDAPSTETKKYHQVSADDVVLYHPQGSTTASVEVKFAADDATLYAQAIVDGKESYSVIDGGVDKLNGDLKSFFGNGNVQNTAIGYKGGKMFYTVPVEHLLKKSAEAVAYAVENEANYGTVRNHWYKINVNSVAKLGHGIFVPGEGEEPGEPLIPENPNDDRFNLGAQINVLSWKVVNQNVDL
ncbi:MAG: fimbria major subunit, partial [Muribaculaceae bacterium]|nr:fimbria major subunit [Muribaculaceae bacterium]